MYGVARICVALFCVLSCVSGQCPSGWLRHNDTCYHFSHDTEPWVVAQTTCAMLDPDAYLAEIKSEPEFLYLSNEMRKLNQIFWIGGTDLAMEGKFMWMRSRTMLKDGYTRWQPGEPNNSEQDENCLDMHDDYQGWNDERCDKSQYYVCQRETDGTGLGLVG